MEIRVRKGRVTWVAINLMLHIYTTDENLCEDVSIKQGHFIVKNK
jgi:hypothetical protein